MEPVVQPPESSTAERGSMRSEFEARLSALPPPHPRDVGWSFVVLTLLTTVVWLPVFFGRSFWYRDILLYAYPLKLAVRQRLLAGEFPLWADAWGTGRPLFGLIQPGVLDPMGLITLLPVPRGLDLFTVSHAYILAWGTWLWLRRLGRPAWHATLGALWLSAGGYFVSMLTVNGSYAWGVPWVPWALASLAAAAKAEDRRLLARSIAGFAVFLSLALLAGDPMAVYFALLAGIAQSAGEESPERRRRAATALLAGAALAGVACAVQLLPALEVAALARSQGVDPVRASYWSFPPERMVEVLFVDFFGAPYEHGWFVHPLYRQGPSAAQEPLVAGVHQGLVVFPLAALALLAPVRRRAEVAWAVFTLAALLVAFGRHFPLWSLWYRVAPLARMFRYPEKYWFLVSMGLAVLASRGLSIPRASPELARRGTAMLALSLCCVAMTVVFFDERVARAVVGTFHRVLAIEAGHRVATSMLRGAAISVAIFLAVRFASLLGAWQTRRLPIVAALLMAEPLLGAPSLQNWASPLIYSKPSVLMRTVRETHGDPVPVTRVLRSLRLTLPFLRVPPEFAAFSLPPNVGMHQGVGHVDVYDALRLDNWHPLRRAIDTDPVSTARVFGARFALLEGEHLMRDGVLPRKVLIGLHFMLAEIDRVSPRAYLAGRVFSARTSEEAFARAMRRDFVYGSDVAIEGLGPAEAVGAPGRCAMPVSRPERVELACDAEAPSHAVLIDTHFPGWSATVDGRPAVIRRANGLFRAVAVPRGRHRVVFTYRPWGLVAGAWISAAGVAILVALAAGRAAGRRRG